MSTVFLPWPDRKLSPNARIDRRARAGVVAEHRDGAYLVASSLTGPKPQGRVEVCIMFHPPDRRRRDLDNCYSMCKAYQDGIFRALGMDDSCIEMVELRFGKPKPQGEVVFTIEEAGEYDHLPA
jgi:crossover junction endodeoxyribonuclease RusA